ncbi:MAG: chemotaxis protein CheW [Moraxellaceae bacterium]|nr:chemotaxis protein CheW [Moraxellaceae bacterium]
MSSPNLPTSAARPQNGLTALGTQQYLTFTLGNELFALPISPIREIIEFPGLTEIPLTPAFLRGVINLRGAVVPVIDLSVRFGRNATGIARRTCIVIVEVNIEDNVHPIGVIVDAVSEVLEVDPTQIEQRPGFGAGLRADFVAGMLNLGGRFVVVLDVSNVLSPDELENLISAAHVAPGSGPGAH